MEDEHKAILGIETERDTYPVGAAGNFAVYCECPSDPEYIESLEGRVVNISDAQGELLAQATLSVILEDRIGSEPFELTMPAESGEHRWQIALLPVLADEEVESGSQVRVSLLEGETVENEVAESVTSVASCEESPSEQDASPIYYEFSCVPHRSSVLGWGLPTTPLSAGERVRLRVGASCLEGCSLVGQIAEVFLADEVVGTGTLGEPQEQKPGLFWTEIEFDVPAEAGLYELEVTLAADSLELEHTSSKSRLPLAVAERPDAMLSVIVLDEPTGNAIADALVTVKTLEGLPYRAKTDAEGKAKITLPCGSYSVSAFDEDHPGDTQEVGVDEAGAEVVLTLKYQPDVGV